MKAARFYEVGKPLKVEDVDIPKIGRTEALIRVRACGICRTDLHFIDEGLLKPGKIPQILGHEASGDVVEVGEDVEEIKVGDRVIIYFYFSCGECYYCQRGMENLCVSPRFRHFGFTIDGGFAEYAKAPARNLLKMPRNVPYEASILVDAGSSSYHAVKTVGQVKVGETALIMGLGGLGLCAMQFAKLCGAKVIGVDVVPEKLRLAKELGADETVNAKEQDVIQEVKKLTDNEGVDVAFEFVSTSKTMEISIDSLRRGGRLVFVGYSEDNFVVSPVKLVYNQLKVFGSRASSKWEAIEVIKLVQSGKFNLKPLITHTVPLDEINHGLDLLRSGKAVRVVVKP
ncbi:MAG: zinc-binding dehydrogenase [Candidatus Bathyarchaeia archaeon]